MNRTLILILLGLWSLGLSLQSAGQSQFQLAVGGATTDDYAYSIIQTADGGYVAAGESYTLAAQSDMYIIKLNSAGSLQWSRAVGGPQSEIASSIVRAADGGYVVASYGESWGLGAYFTKLDSVGAVEWTRVVGGTMNLNYRPVPMVGTTDGGYAVAGSVPSGPFGSSDMYIMKLDANCAPVWCKIFGGTGWDFAWSIAKTSDGGYVVAGQGGGAGGFGMFIGKVDSSGMFQWTKTVGGSSSDIAYSVIQTTDGGYAVAGFTLSFGGGDMYIVKLASDGSLQWSKNIGGINGDLAYSIIQTADGGYAVAGYTFSFGAGLQDIYIVKLDPGGSLQWSRTVGGTGLDIAYSIIQTTDGGYTAAGYTQSFGAADMFIVKLDANGNTCGNSTSPSSSVGTGGILGSPSPTVTSPTPTVVTVSPTIGSLGTVTTICVIGIQPISNEIPDSYKLYQNYPNPFNARTIINFQLSMFNYSKLEVFDVLGRKVSTLVNQELRPGLYQVEWDGTNYASGVYYYQLSIINSQLSIKYQETNRMVLIR